MGKARDIEKKGKFGKADPYVKMTLENQKAKSKTIKNNYNPEWNFTANFEITNETTEGITIEVFDEDIGKDDSLGSMILDLSAVQEYQQFVNQWIPLGKCKSGEVMLSAEFVPLTNLQTDDIVANVISEPIKEAEKESAQEISLIPKEMIVETVQDERTSEQVIETTAATVCQPQKSLEAGQVVIIVYKAKEIEKKGMFGKADPYVKITLEKQEAKSATVKNNHNPEWNFKATFDVDQNTKEGINIAVFDDDFGKDDSLGSTLLDISKVQEHNKLLNQWIPLEKCKSAEVLLSAEFIPLAFVQQQREVEQLVLTASIKESVQEVDLEPKDIKNEIIPHEKIPELVVETTPVEIEKNIQVDSKSKEITKEKAPQVETIKPVDETTPITVSPALKPLEAGQVVVTVYKAKNIEKKGKFGEADPYVKMTLGKHKAKSATVKNNHNPEWNFKATFDVDQN